MGVLILIKPLNSVSLKVDGSNLHPCSIDGSVEPKIPFRACDPSDWVSFFPSREVNLHTLSTTTTNRQPYLSAAAGCCLLFPVVGHHLPLLLNPLPQPPPSQTLLCATMQSRLRQPPSSSATLSLPSRTIAFPYRQSLPPRPRPPLSPSPLLPLLPTACRLLPPPLSPLPPVASSSVVPSSITVTPSSSPPHRLSFTASSPFSPTASCFLLGHALLCHCHPFFLSLPPLVIYCLLPFLPYHNQPAIPLIPLPSASSYALLFLGHLFSFCPLQHPSVAHRSQLCRLCNSSPSTLPQPSLLLLLPPPIYHPPLPSLLLPPHTAAGLCLQPSPQPSSLPPTPASTTTTPCFLPCCCYRRPHLPPTAPPRSALLCCSVAATALFFLC
ncbi:hypothetical protein B296_00023106 [Ensete ventricosum]|uniref:Uncharacterized protein n=1 Tax=Ensete ventricosum TaxID=4639 RepID=A0A426Z2H1_ENSVE|nr:hypothetical protein B296_00023106 [Ensete ventricosum]